MRKLTKTAITVATMATMALGTVASIQADEKKDGWIGSGTNYEYYVNGTKQVNRWVLAGDDWYFLDSDGKMATNSFVRTDAYTSESEVLDRDDTNDLWNTDDFDDDSTFYYVDGSGKMVKGWMQINANSIYLSPNSTKNDKIWYYFGTSGAMYTNAWILSGEDWYAVADNGQMYTNAKLPRDLKPENNNYGYENLEEDSDVYYVDSNGKMVKGWYKTVEADTRVLPAYDGADESDVFSDKGLWIYANPDNGILAWNEWVKNENTWYYIGTGVQPDASTKDKLEITVYENDEDETSKNLINIDPDPNVTEELKDTMQKYKDTDKWHDDIAGTLDERFVMLEDKIVYWVNHDKAKSKYFYLKEDNGAMLTGWYEFDDDYYIWANSSGELANNKVQEVNGRYYYFNRNAICEYKTINIQADYVVKLPDGNYVFYNTDTRPTTNDTYIDDIRISSLKADNPVGTDPHLTQDRYTFGSRSVVRKSLTDLQAVLAYAAENNGSVTGEYEIWKLRNSTTMKAKINFGSAIPASDLTDIGIDIKADPVVTLKDGVRTIGGAENTTTTSSAVTVTGPSATASPEIEADKLESVTTVKNGTVSLTQAQPAIQAEAKDGGVFAANNTTFTGTVKMSTLVEQMMSLLGVTDLSKVNVEYATVVNFPKANNNANVKTEIIVSKAAGTVNSNSDRLNKGDKVNGEVRLVGAGTYEFTVRYSRLGYSAVEKTIKIVVEK